MNEKTNKFLLFNFIHAVLGLYNKGVALFKLQKYDEAIKFFRKSIAIYPNDRQTQLQLDKCISAKKKEIILKNQLSNAFSLI